MRTAYKIGYLLMFIIATLAWGYFTYQGDNDNALISNIYMFIGILGNRIESKLEY